MSIHRTTEAPEQSSVTPASEIAEWTQHRGIGGSYWTHPSLGERCFSGSREDLLEYLEGR